MEGSPVWNEERVHDHCPLIDGTFTMEIGGVPIQIYSSTTNSYSNPDIPYNVGSGTL